MTGTLSPAALVHEAIRLPGVDNPSAFLATNAENSIFTVPGRDGVIVYRPAGAWLVQFGGPFAAIEDRMALLEAFRGFARDQGRRTVAIQLQADDARRYAERGWTVNQVGASYAVDLSTFTLAGTRFMRLRNKISRAHRAGLTVTEADPEQWYDRMRALDRTWLQSKGEHAAELQFLVGQYGGEMQPHRRLFIGRIDGELAGYISYSPVYGSRPGWMHDLSRRIPDETPGLMEAINKAAIDTFLGEGERWLHFGFTPFTSLDGAHELPGHSPAFAMFMQLLWQYGEEAYPARSQLDYKMKWAPSVILPEYIAFDGPAGVHGFAHVFRACGAF
jgi:lysylphosphatidylglycerol synthetase-like protein (DUF2156 family)